MKHLPQVSEQSFAAEVLGSSVPVLVDFSATWCPPCRVLEPILERIAAEAGGALRVVTVDGDEDPGLAARFGVRGFPTTIAFVGGKEVGRQIGAASKERILALLPAGSRSAGKERSVGP